MKTAIVWFKTDLMIYDNEIIKAIEQGEQILPIYCFDDSLLKQPNMVLKKTGSYRTQLESLIFRCYCVNGFVYLF
jgi:deoxyribodipyrimidine photo-lyase